MNYQAIQELIKTINNSELYNLEIESEGTRIKMAKGPDQVIDSNRVCDVNHIVEAQSGAADLHVLEAPKSSAVVKVLEVVKATEENLYVIKSPIVSTFYASSSPEKDNFVSVGSKVKKGSILCILEAMRLMNEIKTDVGGEIVEILVQSESMVEYGQPLFKIRECG
ncbi:acetyl-CoA carboxylase biotin carboxyl carrier protein [Clostridium bowmanii]|uniref:acetyl-CoA carboxylase biotin carboxyl carrier protein n=1 Tax=Clostridium bowmanii TaxID=132925 RepID=UPI001C0B6F0F|nr:acetyl-CoA carboxylase biotin carboxyl carrier protein [Clostridium bowmanii]MBU3188252.1 acetyl-CoA carboxylase biotin carboxyl carrier protein [Clostridium bowmanii]MCA1072638.1 acetyl-CoA carboxylase biotin carboxyl carrier protein [Clostridium bowmanii]